MEAIEVQDIPVPDVEPGTVRVAVSAASINFGDIARCVGGVASVVAQPPFTLGMDVCGVVEAAGAGAEQWLGRRVVAMCAMSFGGMAEFAICPVNGVFDAPAELDDVEAAAFLLPFHTTWLAVHERAKVQAGETMLVVGGATALGTAAIQLGVAAGARVIAVAGGTEKGALCRQLGAELAIDHTADDLFDRIMAHTGEHGVDAAIDMIGGAGTEAVWTCMALGGRYVPVGFNDDPESGNTGKPLRKVSMGNFSVHGLMVSYNHAPLPMRKFGVHPNPIELGPKVHGALCELVTSGAIRPVIGRRIGLDEVAATLEDHGQRRTSGRSVVDLSIA
ncbi:MAG: Zn-dependent oxidoreductase, NADPH:quinone reductase [Actinomycetia bacterium]|nr:Zn-dependent oxidoreductase, NADPH:quinone reductase [Actinomycetes bacterium]